MRRNALAMSSFSRCHRSGSRRSGDRRDTRLARVDSVAGSVMAGPVFGKGRGAIRPRPVIRSIRVCVGDGLG